jgi:hypothetical protein
MRAVVASFEGVRSESTTNTLVADERQGAIGGLTACHTMSGHLLSDKLAAPGVR